MPASTSSLPAREVTALAFDEDDTLWIGTRCGGIFTYRAGALSYKYDALNTGTLPDSGIRSITVGARGQKLVRLAPWICLPARPCLVAGASGATWAMPGPRPARSP